MNEELEQKGFITIAGRVSRKNIMKKILWHGAGRCENNNTIRNLTGEYKKIEPDCREGVRVQL